MLRYWVVPEPKYLQLGAILKATNFKEIRNEVLSQVQLSQILALLEVF